MHRAADDSDAMLPASFASLANAIMTTALSGHDICRTQPWTISPSTVPVEELTNTWVRKAVAAVIDAPEGYLAAVAYYTCMQNVDPGDELASAVGDVLQRWPGHRGPRSSTQTAILSAGLELDDASKKLDVPEVTRDYFRGTAGRGFIGTLGAITTDGKATRLEWAKKSAKQEECTGVKSSNKIVQILANGTLVYESWCTGWRSVTVDVTPQHRRRQAGSERARRQEHAAGRVSQGQARSVVRARRCGPIVVNAAGRSRVQ